MGRPRKPIDPRKVAKAAGIQIATVATNSAEADDHMQAASHIDDGMAQMLKILDDAFRAQGLKVSGVASLLTSRHHDAETNKAIRRAWRSIRKMVGVPAPGVYGKRRDFEEPATHEG